MSTLFTFSVMGIVALPSDDVIDIPAVSFFSDETVTRLSIAQTMARVPCTTKCSPKRIIFPGAIAFDVK